MADYDGSLTRVKYTEGEGKADSSFLAMSKHPLTPDYVRQEKKDSFEKYYPIECDRKISREEKLKNMTAWWHSNFSTIASAGFHERDFAQMAMDSKLLFRKGMFDMLKVSEQAEVPMLVISGAIQPIIEAHFSLLLET
jgi:hypothetical protein